MKMIESEADRSCVFTAIHLDLFYRSANRKYSVVVVSEKQMQIVRKQWLLFTIWISVCDILILGFICFFSLLFSLYFRNVLNANFS